MKSTKKERLLASSLMAAVAAPLAVGSAVMLSATDAHAQQSYTSQDLSGRVVDSSGAPVSGATVTTVSSQGVTRTATTGADGSFRFSAVPGGEYSVTVTASGFDTADTFINVAPGSSTYAFTLARAGSDEIVVTAARVRDFNRTDTGTVFDVQELAERVPLGRSINSAVLLTPSAGLADVSIQANGVRRNQSAVSLSGTSAAESVYYINGLNVTDQRTFLGYADLPFDFIQTIETKTGGYSAEFGRGTGGIVNIVTRSGSNEFHGGVSVNYSPDSLRGDVADAFAPGGNNSVGQQVFNNMVESESLEGTVWASGPIIPDHIFFFALYNPRDIETWGGAGFARPTSADGIITNLQYDDPRWGAKLDFVLNEDHRVEATFFDDSTTTNYNRWNVLRTTRAIGASASPNGSNPDGSLLNYSEESGGLTQIYQYTGTFTDWLTVSALYGKNESAYRDYGAHVTTPGVSDFGQAGTPFLTVGRSDGPFNISGEEIKETFRVDVDFVFDLAGQHHLRVGYDREDLESVSVQQYNGGAQFQTFSQAQCGSFFGAASGADGCAYVFEYLNNGVFDSEQTAWYIQDSWSVTDRLTLQLGVRADIYEYNDIEGNPYISIDDQYAPRLGLTYDLTPNTRFSASYGHYYLPIATNTSIRAASGEIFRDSVWDITRTAGVPNLDANGAPILGANLNYSGGPYYYYSPPGAPDPRAVTEENLDPMYESGFTLGLTHDFDRGILNGWTLGVNLTHRELESTIEDTAIGDAVDRYCTRLALTCSSLLSYFPYILVNPGDGARVFIDLDADFRYLSPGVLNPAYNPQWINLTAADLALPETERTYDALTLTFERPFDGRWGLQGSYTLAHSQGNYEGAVKSDIGQTDTSITQDFDHAANMVGADGDLPNDRRHTLRLFGTYAPFERFTVGANFFLQSGRPYGCTGYTPTSIDPYAPTAGTPSTWYCPQGAATATPANSTLQGQMAALGLPTQYVHQSVLVGRGNSGETDWVNQLDLNFSYRFWGDEDEDRGSLTASLDIFNVFDNDAVIRVVEQGEVRTSSTAAGAKGVQAPFWGMPRTYQGPRSVRFGFRYAF